MSKTESERPTQTARVLVLQPAVPHYRLDFFSRLARRYGSAFHVYSSALNVGILTKRNEAFAWEHQLGPIRSLPVGAEWQTGALGIKIARGDRLVIWGAPRTLSNFMLLLRARLCGAKVIWWGHYLSPTSSPIRHALRVNLMRMAHGLLFYTEREVEAYRATRVGARDLRPVGALNNGVDTTPIAARRSSYRAEDRDHAALFIGRLTEKSELGLAIKALARPEASRLSLHVVGDGEDGETLRAQAQALGLDNRVVWHGATTDEDKIADIANRCRFFLYPGSVGLSLVHGMAYGLPVLVHSSLSAHMPEIAALVPGENGVTFQRANAANLAAVASQLVDDDALLDSLSKGALSTILGEYNTARMDERFGEYLELF